MDILFFIAALEAAMRNEGLMLQDRRDRCEANIREHRAAMRADEERKLRLKAVEDSFGERDDDAPEEEVELLEILKRDGAKAWKDLKRENKWNKQVILAVFESGNLPIELKEPGFCDDESEVPPSIRDDREILLARIKRKQFNLHYKYYSQNPNATLFRIPEQHLDDEEVVATAVSRYPEVLLQSDSLPATETLDSKEVFLSFVLSDHTQKIETISMKRFFSMHIGRERFENLISLFSVGLRANAELLLKVAKHIQHGAIFAHFSEELSDDCAFALELAKLTERVPKNALERFSDRVKADREVVLTLVQKNGLCLKDADEALKRDPDLVRAACKQNGTTILHCSPETRQAFGGDKDFMLEHVFRNWGWRVPGSPELYKDLSATLKLDRDIIVAAAEHKNLSLSDLPEELTSDRGFWMDVIQCKSSFWLALPQEFEDDPAFAFAIEDFEASDMVHGVFRRFPFLRRDRDIWLKIVSSDSNEFYDEEVLSNLIQQYAPEHIRTDQEIMRNACENDYSVFGILGPELQQNRDILHAAIERSPYALDFIPASVQHMYPDLIADIFETLVNVICEALDEDHAAMVAAELWNNVEVVTAWFENGGRDHTLIPATMKRNPEFGLLVAKYCEFNEFAALLPTKLRSDKSFMSKAVDIDKYLGLTATGALCQDYDFAVLVYSTEDAFYLLEHESPERIRFLHTVLEKAEEKVEAHEGFTEAFVYGMTANAGPDCHLPLLVRDKETSVALKQRIADFLGVPKTSKDLEKLRQVISNLDSFNCYCGMCHH